jgi:hypothetical protein
MLTCLLEMQAQVVLRAEVDRLQQTVVGKLELGGM